MNLLEYMVERGLKLERRGLDWWCSCPFHKDDTPSMHVSERDGKWMWHCFSCKRGGGAVEFMAEEEGVPVWAARRKWAEAAGEALPDSGRESLTRAVEALAVSGHSYLRGRGISDETCRKFGLGFCEDYREFLSRVGLEPQEAAGLGLFDFSGSIIYPFFDHLGCYKVAARSVSGKEYRNSPQGSAHAREGLWGLHLFRGREAWIFEGYHDAMVARQAGYEALAAAGTSMARQMWEELKAREVDRVVFVPDGDPAGVAWLGRLAEEAPTWLTVEFVALRSGDPDDAILAGSDLRAQAVTPFEWSLSRYPMGSLAERVRAVRACSKAFLRMPREQRELSRGWFEREHGDGGALDWLQVDVQPELEAERVVLANCLFSKGARLEAVQALDGWHFNTKAHRNAFDVIRERGEASMQMVQVELGIDLSPFVDLENYRYYIDRVKEAGVRARVSRALARADPSDVGAAVEELYRAVDRTTVRDGVELVAEVVERINARVHNPSMLGIPIPYFPTLTKVLLGLVPGRLILISGNSGHGKTTLACNIVDGIVDRNAVLFVTLEMTEGEILEKQIAIRSGVPSVKMQTGSLQQAEYDLVLEAARSLKHGLFQVVYGVNDLYKMVALVKAHVMRKRVRVVVVDYVQLISVPGNDERWQQLSRVTNTLKVQLCPLGVTVLALTQLKRSSLNSDVPDAADQAGAYAMLADGDAAITVRKVDPKETKDGSNFLLNVSKNRFGLDDVVIPCLFDRNLQRIRELGA